MSDQAKEQAISEKEMKVWSRLIERRRDDWRCLPRHEMLAILQPLWDSFTENPPFLSETWERAEWLLQQSFSIAINRKISPDDRRTKWDQARKLLDTLDQTCTRYKNTENDSLNTSIETTASLGPPWEILCPPRQETIDIQHANDDDDISGAEERNSAVATEVAEPPTDSVQPATPPLTAKKPAVAPVPPSSTTKTTVSTQPAQTEQAAQPSHQQDQLTTQLTQQQQQRQVVEPSIAQRDPGAQSQSTTSEVVQQQQKSDPRQAAAASQSPSSELPAATKEHINAMGSIVSAPATKVAPAPPLGKENKKSPPTRLLQPSTISFRPDSQKSTGALAAWPAVNVTFREMAIEQEEISQALQRLRTWEPYWKIEHVICIKKTSPVTKCTPTLTKGYAMERRKYDLLPIRQAVECNVMLNAGKAKLVKNWGQKKVSQKCAPNELRLLVRMLPLKLTRSKRPRADTHLWPKGTFLQLNSDPLDIRQRKQQSHDPTEWSYMSHSLDLTLIMDKPLQRNRLLCYVLDEEVYVMCVALCRYVSPATLYDNIMHESINKLSMEDAKAKALVNAKRQIVVLDETDSDAPNEISSFIVPLTCPISQQLIKTPVRREQCKHWQCFDLRNFCESNAHVAGSRWQCPVCTSILCYRDLQYCPLTASVLEELKGCATSQRDRVQYFSDGTWQLLGENRKRYSKKRSPDETNEVADKRPRSGAPVSSVEVIEIL